MPEPRAGTASAMVEGELILIGGWDGRTAFADAHALSLSTLRWRSLSLRGTESLLSDRIMFGHASSDDLVYIHGGCSPKNLAEIFADVFTVNTKTGKMQELDTEGTGPGKIARHANAIMHGHLYAFGGWDGKRFRDETFRLDLRTRGAPRWEQLVTSGFTPYARAMACLVAWERPRPHLMLYGGGNSDTDFAATYALDVETRYWERLTNVRSRSRCSSPCFALWPRGSLEGAGRAGASPSGRRGACWRVRRCRTRTSRSPRRRASSCRASPRREGRSSSTVVSAACPRGATSRATGRRPFGCCR